MAPEDTLIVQVIQRYFEDWEPPMDTGREWISVACPFHGETRPSAAVSYEHNAYRCFACSTKGDAIALIRHMEEVSFAEAVRITEELSPGGNNKVRTGSTRLAGRRVHSKPGVPRTVGGGLNREVPSRLRGRPAPWT
ncbi:DNA primase [Rhodococcus phage Partridge]|uniref:DNA primase n=3 Tax=Rhodococcus virus Takoda TaxID=2846062 RepID=A0A6G6XSU2_9CAUD|nr:DNA primase [Rhodococcus phage Partridge]AQP30930.1 DNA primase [Rhodococcus phage AngryOrchard]QIG61658.1 DNA primase [Rhodococcus phage Dinger]